MLNENSGVDTLVIGRHPTLYFFLFPRGDSEEEAQKAHTGTEGKLAKGQGLGQQQFDIPVESLGFRHYTVIRYRKSAVRKGCWKVPGI